MDGCKSEELLHEVDQNGDGSIDFEVLSLWAKPHVSYDNR